MASGMGKYIYKWKVDSSSSKNKSYIVSLTRKGELECGCMAWTRRRIECKHIKYIRGNYASKIEMLMRKYGDSLKLNEISVADATTRTTIGGVETLTPEELGAILKTMNLPEDKVQELGKAFGDRMEKKMQDAMMDAIRTGSNVKGTATAASDITMGEIMAAMGAIGAMNNGMDMEKAIEKARAMMAGGEEPVKVENPKDEAPDALDVITGGAMWG